MGIDQMAFESDDKAKAYWSENIRLVLGLLAIWFSVSFLFGIVLVEPLNEIRFFGFKLGFWFAQQGSIYVFVALIFVYVAKMNAIDRKYDVHED
ncbi:membrane protein [Paraferrimonas sedimenticola]|uniref:Membrane protein n=2 Tax=Paraferrimonas sedimenticola TaxID=375674 RepID=A0AA37RVU8_9GAMM|nr:membrane protein [Paraferrimonas sedimenticola]